METSGWVIFFFSIPPLFPILTAPGLKARAVSSSCYRNKTFFMSYGLYQAIKHREMRQLILFCDSMKVLMGTCLNGQGKN